MKISVATKSKLEIIKKLAYKIWPSTYGTILPEVQLKFMLDKFYNLDYLTNLLIHENQVFLLIEENNEYLGFCSYELNYQSSNKTKLHKIYILPETQGKGIGKFALAAVEKIALENKNTILLLNVNRGNKAQEFYKKQGYLIVKTIDIEIENGYLMEDFVMEKEL
ncbi:GNAT family N-acetyltransferase [Flavobacterium psychrophilum]|uniref:Acetyltransferase, GNAT family n=2 Tax=Flavobacterium psychrophilum TaxID=96345 RepID=A6GZM4_FLAPJ|nr:GNAT family N-acetyltransferase [Flavobacterium psychrophilum]AIG30249.1 acetyltransferase [Flavobacterium psychrophilum]AIG32524.1 acetyltransferase [Flavobacterium psychrophilum]AIG34679.1 acetyltransferase [Flavobacterium psychrophilum]AIG37043.1 acetyltransferase [Flavobacterium psychrophilum]AIG39307.1 acetyltransferase [Flavobacterium psychrophilum]